MDGWEEQISRAKALNGFKNNIDNATHYQAYQKHWREEMGDILSSSVNERDGLEEIDLDKTDTSS